MTWWLADHSIIAITSEFVLFLVSCISRLYHLSLPNVDVLVLSLNILGGLPNIFNVQNAEEESGGFL